MHLLIVTSTIRDHGYSWKTKTYQNCDVGKKIDRKEGNVRLWVVKVTYNNIAATSWQYVLFGGWCNTVSMVSYCTCNISFCFPSRATKVICPPIGYTNPPP
jgi:hypothetical protein